MSAIVPAWSRPSAWPSALRGVARWLVGPLIAAALSWGAWQIYLLPPWPSYEAVAAITFVVVAAMHAAALLALRAWPGGRLLRALRWAAAGAVLLWLAYLFLWVFFTCPVSIYGPRIVIGWAWSETARAWQAEQPVPLGLEDLLDDMGDDPDLVFERTSLGVMRFATLATYLAAGCALSFLAAGFGLALGRRAGGPALAALQARVEAWPAAAPARLRVELARAVDTLCLAGNLPGAVLTAVGLLEGQEGLLGQVARAAGRPLKGGTLEAQIGHLAQEKALPEEIAFDLHRARKFGNTARHRPAEATRTDAETALLLVAHFAEWYLHDFAQGPRLGRAEAGASAR